MKKELYSSQMEYIEKKGEICKYKFHIKKIDSFFSRTKTGGDFIILKSGANNLMRPDGTRQVNI